jgi:hypothetical protein
MARHCKTACTNAESKDLENKQTPWLESVTELHRPSDRRLSAKLVPTFTDSGCHVVSATDLLGHILASLDRVKIYNP